MSRLKMGYDYSCPRGEDEEKHFKVSTGKSKVETEENNG